MVEQQGKTKVVIGKDIPQQTSRYELSYGSYTTTGGDRMEKLIARLGRNVGATLEYCWREEEKFWNIEDLDVNEEYQRRGLGSNLLKDFVGRVGHEQPIHGVVTHEDTVALAQERYAVLAGEKGSCTIEGEALGDIPIVRVFSKGNIQVKRMVISYLESHDEYEVRVWGFTK